MGSPIPTTLDEAFKVLDTILCNEDRRYIQEAEDPHKAVASLHHTLGMHIRNEWGLWGNSELKRDIAEKYGIIHPDDVSALILREYARARYPTRYDRLKTKD